MEERERRQLLEVCVGRIMGWSEQFSISTENTNDLNTIELLASEVVRQRELLEKGHVYKIPEDELRYIEETMLRLGYILRMGRGCS